MNAITVESTNLGRDGSLEGVVRRRAEMGRQVNAGAGLLERKKLLWERKRELLEKLFSSVIMTKMTSKQVCTKYVFPMEERTGTERKM